jgi:hypothetical protein
MIGGWHWRGEPGSPPRRMLPPSPGTLFKIAAPCDDRGDDTPLPRTMTRRQDSRHTARPFGRRRTSEAAPKGWLASERIMDPTVIA